MVTFALGLLDEDRRAGFMTDFSYVDVHVPRYGLYCGPGWTGGIVDGNDFRATPVDDLDAACLVHDRRYGLAETTALTSPVAAARIQNIADWALIEASWNSVPADQANSLYAGIYALGVVITFPVQVFFRSLEIKQMEGANATDRRNSMIGDDAGMQARYDSPHYDFQTPDGRGITRAYVDAYAAGDLRAAAQLLVRSGGGNIYPDPADGFYPDAIIRRQAGYEGGVPPAVNQVLARDYVRAVGTDNDPNTYPDAILRKAAGYEGGGRPTRESAADKANQSHNATQNRDRQESAADRASQNQNQSRSHNQEYNRDRQESSADRTSHTQSQSRTESRSHNQEYNRDRQGPTDRTATEGRRPVPLDLDGDGVKITEYQNSTQFMTGKDGLQHRTSWAGPGMGCCSMTPTGGMRSPKSGSMSSPNGNRRRRGIWKRSVRSGIRTGMAS